jgi:hypothetical protein
MDGRTPVSKDEEEAKKEEAKEKKKPCFGAPRAAVGQGRAAHPILESHRVNWLCSSWCKRMGLAT